jgi:hypothetical protein
MAQIGGDIDPGNSARAAKNSFSTGLKYFYYWRQTIDIMHPDFLAFFWIFIGLLIGAGFLHLLPQFGPVGQQLTQACCRAPLLDVIVFYFTFLPLIVGPLIAGWFGFLSAVLAQLATLLTWQAIHEALHREAMKGPRIIKVLNGKDYPGVYKSAR